MKKAGFADEGISNNRIQMNNSTKLFIVVYGLYIGWLLSFLYSGPLFNVVLELPGNRNNIMLVMMNFIPIALFGMGKVKFIHRANDRKWLIGSVSASLLISILFIMIGQGGNNTGIYVLILVLAVVAGIAQLSFILSSTGWYIRYIPTQYMFMAMAMITLIANIVVMICKNFLYYGYEKLAVWFMVMTCAICLILIVMIKEKDGFNRPDVELHLPKNMVVLMSAAFFFFSIGGGVVLETIHPVLLNGFHKIAVIDISPYVVTSLIMAILLYQKNSYIEYFLAVAAGLIVAGLMAIQIDQSRFSLMASNVLIESGYSVMDTFMWGLVGMLGYVYNKPYLIVYFTMSANVIGVVAGTQISSYSNNPGSLLPVMISLVSAVFGMLVIPMIYKKVLVKLNQGMEQIEESNQYLDKVNKKEKFNELTLREREVLNLLGSGMTYKAIAKELYISENTLKKHAKSIYSKTGIKNKKELIEVLRETGQ